MIILCRLTSHIERYGVVHRLLFHEFLTTTMVFRRCIEALYMEMDIFHGGLAVHALFEQALENAMSNNE
jgi:hypothetical protein